MQVFGEQAAANLLIKKFMKYKSGSRKSLRNLSLNTRKTTPNYNNQTKKIGVKDW